MKKLYQFAISAIVLTAVVLLGGPSVLAQSRTVDEVRTNETEQRSAVRCERVQQSLETRTTRVSLAATNQTALYERLNGRIANVIAGADNRGFPTDTLRSAQTEVAQRITDFGLAADVYTASLSESAAITCDESVARYSAAIAVSRQNIQSVRTAAIEVRTTFQEQVIPALREFKVWLEENQPTTEQE
jgi:hypothetical protein